MTAATTTSVAPQGPSVLSALRPLLVEVGIPVGAYFVARDALGLGIVASFIVSSVPAVITSVFSMIRTRHVNGVSALVLAVNVAGLVASYVSGGIRLTFAVNAATSIVIGLGFLLSSWRGRPITSAGAKPWITKGDPAREDAYSQLACDSARFRALDRKAGYVWGVAFTTDSLVRIALSAFAPASVLGWISTPVLVVALVVAGIGGGIVGIDPMTKLVDERVGSPSAAR